MPPSLPPITQTSTPTAKFVDKFIDTIASAFATTPHTTTFINEIDGHLARSAAAPCTKSTTHARRRAHFEPYIRSIYANNDSTKNAIAVESSDFAAVASWEPPTYAGVPFTRVRRDPGPIFAQWRAHVARMEAKYVGYVDPSAETAIAENQPGAERKLKPHWHLAFLARDPAKSDVKGAISAVMLPFLERAREEGVPIWLEATYPHAVAVYEHYGFRVCEEVVIGAGKVGPDGWPKEDGEGVRAWGMIFDGHIQSA